MHKEFDYTAQQNIIEKCFAFLPLTFFSESFAFTLKRVNVSYFSCFKQAKGKFSFFTFLSLSLSLCFFFRTRYLAMSFCKAFI